MHKSYQLAIFYFLAFSILLVSSALMLFAQKIGFSAHDVTLYYIGCEERFIPAKTMLGTLKIELPHIFSFGLFIMVLAHFLIFTKMRFETSTRIVIFLSFLSAFLELTSPFMILSGFLCFAYLKIFSLFLFIGLTLYILWLLFFSIIYE